MTASRNYSIIERKSLKQLPGEKFRKNIKAVHSYFNSYFNVFKMFVILA